VNALAGLPLSETQLRSVVESTARINVWHGSIRSGKTIASLLRWLIFVGTQAPAHGELVIVGKTRETIERNVLTPLQDATLFGPIARLVTHTTGANTCMILGRVVHLIGANDAKAEGKLRGLTCAGVYVDEATLLPEAFWNQLLGRCSVEGARIFATTNPDSPAHWLRRNFLQRGGLDLRQFPFRLADNPSLTKTYVDAISTEYVGLWYRRFILGEWVAAEGAIFDMWDEDRHVVDGDLPLIGRWWVGIDYGTTNPFAAILLGLAGDGVVYAADEYRYDSTAARRQLTDSEYSTNLRAWLQRAKVELGADPEWIYVDPSAASFKTQLRRDAIDGVRDGDNDVLDGIRLMSSALANGRHKVHRRCPGLIEEIPGYVWDPKATADGVDKPLKTGDHSIDADRYGLQTGRRMWWNEQPAAA
jgi:PBSX family phage terminase large subunit